MTRLKSYDENSEECAYFLIRPDPRCPECAAIMDWRSNHRWIAIPNRAEIRLSDKPLGIHHLHARDQQVARQKNRLVQQRKQTAGKENFPTVA